MLGWVSSPVQGSPWGRMALFRWMRRLHRFWPGHTFSGCLLQAIQDATLEEQSLKDALEKLAGQSEVSGQTCMEVPSECAALPSWLTSSGEGAVAVDDWVTSSAFPDATVQVKAEPLQSFGSPPQASHTPSHPGGRSGVLPLSPPPGDFASPYLQLALPLRCFRLA